MKNWANVTRFYRMGRVIVAAPLGLCLLLSVGIVIKMYYTLKLCCVIFGMRVNNFFFLFCSIDNIDRARGCQTSALKVSHNRFLELIAMRLHYNFYMRESFFFSEYNKQIIFPSSLAVSVKRAQSFVVVDLVCPKDITPDDIVDTYWKVFIPGNTTVTPVYRCMCDVFSVIVYGDCLPPSTIAARCSSIMSIHSSTNYGCAVWRENGKTINDECEHEMTLNIC